MIVYLFRRPRCLLLGGRGAPPPAGCPPSCPQASRRRTRRRRSCGQTQRGGPAPPARPARACRRGGRQASPRLKQQCNFIFPFPGLCVSHAGHNGGLTSVRELDACIKLGVSRLCVISMSLPVSRHTGTGASSMYPAKDLPQRPEWQPTRWRVRDSGGGGTRSGATTPRHQVPLFGRIRMSGTSVTMQS